MGNLNHGPSAHEPFWRRIAAQRRVTQTHFRVEVIVRLATKDFY